MIKSIRLKLARLFAPKGYVLVPEEPTSKMLQAAASAMSPKKRPTAAWVSVREKHMIRYKAMIKAAA